MIELSGYVALFELVQVLRAGFFSGKPFDKLAETKSFLFGPF